MREHLTKSEYIKTSLIQAPVTKWERFEYFLWRDFISLAYQHLQAAPWVNKHIVAVWRVLSFLFLFGLSLYLEIQSPLLSFVYFTKWGIFLCTITYGFLASFHVRQYVCLRTKESIIKNYRKVFSPWLLWKWSIIFYEASFTFETVIVLFYWSVLYEEQDHNEPNFLLMNILMHAAPMFILTVDYIFNRIPFKIVHLPLAMIIMIIYGLVNLSYTLASGTPVYPPLNFKDGMSYVWAVMLLVLESGAFYLMHVITNLKLRKYRQMDMREQHS